MITEFLIKNILADILFESRICESLEDRQIINYLYDHLMLEKLLFGEPVSIEELRNILRKKIVNFEFIKLNGEIRPAKGTLRMDYVPLTQHPKGIRSSPSTVTTFYDLDKMDWRSVSQRSKEIVLKKDEDTGKPVVMVKDKEDGDTVAVKDVKPIGTIDGKPAEEPTAEEKPEISKVKPVEVGDNTKRFYLLNPNTNASKILDISPKDFIKKLKELGKDWNVISKEQYDEHEEDIKQKSEEDLYVEPEEELEEPEETENTPTEETNTQIEDIINREDDLDNIPADEI